DASLLADTKVLTLAGAADFVVDLGSGDVAASRVTGDVTVAGGDGANSIRTGSGADTFNLASGDFVAGDSINGGGGTDTINFTTIGVSSLVLCVATISNVEKFVSFNGTQTVTMTASQFAGFSSIDLGS